MLISADGLRHATLHSRYGDRKLGDDSRSAVVLGAATATVWRIAVVTAVVASTTSAATSSSATGWSTGFNDGIERLVEIGGGHLGKFKRELSRVVLGKRLTFGKWMISGGTDW